MSPPDSAKISRRQFIANRSITWKHIHFGFAPVTLIIKWRKNHWRWLKWKFGRLERAWKRRKSSLLLLFNSSSAVNLPLLKCQQRHQIHKGFMSARSVCSRNTRIQTLVLHATSRQSYLSLSPLSLLLILHQPKLVKMPSKSTSEHTFVSSNIFPFGQK